MISPAPPSSSGSDSFDLVVVGGTPAGIACAVRAAREGLSVALVNRHGHLGGILSSGLAVWDTIWEGKRSPIYDEVRAALIDYYRTTYGEDSPQHRDSLPAKTGHLIGRFEARVAEIVLTALVAREPKITLLKGLVPIAANRDGARLKTVTLRAPQGGPEWTLRAQVFADCTYEGDLAALAQVPYRVGRESREEFGEPHAGIIFMHPVSQLPGPEAAETTALHDQLKLRKVSGWQVLTPQSTGAADGAVQACNYRTTLTTHPANRLPIPKPEHYAPYHLRSLEIFAGIERVPNDKYGWNRPQLVGRQTAYVEADWPARQRILDEHWEMTMGLIYFLQHDATVPEIVRKAWLEFGLPKDEFSDHGHRPYEIYVREARRISGRAVFTQHDAMLASGQRRAPAHPDSIAMTEWYIDSHSCTPIRIPGALEEGKVMLHQETFPGQVSYRCLLPQGVDNLLVPVCLSATHIGWNVVRLEPVFMQIGEAAGLAAALALATQTTVAELDSDRLVRALCVRRSMVAFFNDVDVSASDAWIPAIQYFGGRGFFSDYDARPHEALRLATAEVWAEGLRALLAGRGGAQALMAKVLSAESQPGSTVSVAEFAAWLPKKVELGPVDPLVPITRGQAMQGLWVCLN